MFLVKVCAAYWSGEKTPGIGVCSLLLALQAGALAFCYCFTSEDRNFLMGLGQMVCRFPLTPEIVIEI